MSSPQRNLYFAYGSNLWLLQMALRCPNSPYVGIARLEGWKFIINERRSSTVAPSPIDHCFGLVYELTPEDEVILDINERMPLCFEKKYLEVTFWTAEDGMGGEVVPDVKQDGTQEKALVYVDPRRKEGEVKEEYVFRMGMGIEDGITKGIPKAYFDEYVRPWIPEKSKEELLANAKPNLKHTTNPSTTRLDAQRSS